MGYHATPHNQTNVGIIFSGHNNTYHLYTSKFREMHQVCSWLCFFFQQQLLRPYVALQFEPKNKDQNDIRSSIWVFGDVGSTLRKTKIDALFIYHVDAKEEIISDLEGYINKRGHHHRCIFENASELHKYSNIKDKKPKPKNCRIKTKTFTYPRPYTRSRRIFKRSRP